MSDGAARGARSNTLLSRVLRSVMLLLLLGGVLVAVTAWLNGRQAAWAAYDRILLGAASDVAESIRIQNGAPVVDLPVSAFELLAQAPDDRVSYAVRGPDMELLTGMADAAFPVGQGARGIAPVFHDARMQGDAARFVMVTRLFSERDFTGAVRVSVGQTLAARQAMAVGLMVDAMVPIAVAGLALLLVSYFVIRAAVRPLETIARNLRDRDPHDLTPVPAADLPGEVQVMLDAMNRFMGRLDRQIEVMRNLISDTAHQLRTPVAAIRVQAETVAGQDDPTLAQPTLDRLVARTRSLGRLLDQLLSRAMVIHRTDSIPRRAFDLRDTALEVLDQRDHEVLAPEVEVRLVIDDAPVMVLADSFSLAQAAGNLLSNALRHGQPPVRIGVTAQGAEAVIWVEDSGPGPAPDVMARLGGRFARTNASPEDSAGLGMSIVFAVAEAFDGRVDMTRSEAGFRIALVLPCATEAAA